MQGFSDLKHTVITWKVCQPYPKVSDMAVLGWSPRICISKQFPSYAVISDPGQHFEKKLEVKYIVNTGTATA